uniref:N-alpha-acetyltransferase 20 n=1 Tax=Sus scrofa TaxID=9823 RepID=A0A4X1V2F3_PIG
MTTLRAFTCDDLFRFNNINLDPLTETYGIPFYLQYLAHWPEYFIVAEAPGGELMGYIMGKAEGSVAREEWHGHVTALSVAPEFRRLGLAAKLMELLEEISERKGGFFVDLFVRVSNQVAVNMYKQLGYSVYRTVIEYYSASNGEPDEDAYDMRKALSRDTEKKSIIPLPHPVRPEDIENHCYIDIFCIELFIEALKAFMKYINLSCKIKCIVDYKCYVVSLTFLHRALFMLTEQSLPSTPTLPSCTGCSSRYVLSHCLSPIFCLHSQHVV